MPGFLLVQTCARGAFLLPVGNHPHSNSLLKGELLFPS